MALDFGSLIEAGSASVLNELLAPLRDDDGIALPSRYEVRFGAPSGSRGTGGPGASQNLFSQILFEDIGGGITRDVAYQCHTIALPSRALTTVADETIYGPARNLVQGYTFGDVSATLYCHNDMREKKFFETWQRIAFNPQTFAMGYYDDYVGNVKIYTLDQQNNRRYGVELVEAFPETLGEQPLSGAVATSAMEITVGFKYRYWRNLTDESELPKPLLDRLQNVLGDQVERQLLNRIPKVLRRL
tara:strand:- start:1375 stop:2109 length:735 start_codon:yes stop_codon:yes gene_type:complete